MLLHVLQRPPAAGMAGQQNQVSVVLGAQWGDEGKGKLVDLLAEDMEVVCRYSVPRCSTLPYILY